MQDELACRRCQPVEHDLAEARTVLQTMAEENAGLAEELAGARNTIRTLERQLTKLRGDLDKATEADADSKQIRGIQEYWKKTTGHPRAKVSLTGERAKLVKSKLRTYTVKELMEAIDGVALLPYMAFGKRYAYPAPERTIATQLDHCIGNDRRVDENRAIYHRAQKGAEHHPDRLWEAYKHHSAVAEQYFRLALATVHEETDEDRAKAVRFVAQLDHEWEKLEADFPDDFAPSKPDEGPHLKAVA